MAHRIVARLLVAASVVAALGLLTPPSAPASCVGPQLTVGTAAAVAPTTPGSPTRVVRGQALVVDGVWFHDGCADTSVRRGCSGPRPVDPETPMRHVELTLVQGDRSWTLGTADASGPESHFGIRWKTVVPGDVHAGPATLHAGTATTELSVWR